MKAKLHILLIIISTVSFSTASDDAFRKKSGAVIRVVPYKNYCFRCEFVNPTEEEMFLRGVSAPFLNRNNFIYRRLDDQHRRVIGLGASVSYRPGAAPPPLKIGPYQEYNLIIKMKHMKYSSKIFGHYARINWLFGGKSSNSLYVGFLDEKGEVIPPAIPSSEELEKQEGIKLAYIFNEEAAGQIAFLFLNTGSKPRVLMKDGKCQLVLSSPVLAESVMIVMENNATVEKIVEPGAVYTSRMDWLLIREAISDENMQKILKGGGDVDLVWKGGDMESPPLLMNLLPPEKHVNSRLVPKASDGITEILSIEQE